MRTQETDIAVIGAGPAGSVVAALLRDRGWQVTVLERSHFPRFTIGESLLPRCMEALAAADMLEPLGAAGFQVKSGVYFNQGDQAGYFSFAEQFTPGWSWTWHVPRADFDQILATEAQRRGADVRFGHTIEQVDFRTPGAPQLTVVPDDGERYQLSARFVCDASGAARVLPRLLGLDQRSDVPPRAAMFAHVEDRIADPGYRREDITIAIHPEHNDVWYWLIAFAGGRASLGVVGDPALVHGPAETAGERLRERVAEEPRLARLLAAAAFDSPVRQVINYAGNVEHLHGRDYALLGNAGGFIDPVFSSGVTVALESSVKAASLIDEQLRGQTPAWDTRFERPLRAGLRVFRAFIDAWYSGALRHVFLKTHPDPEIRGMIGSILAGYVWDERNPYVAVPERRLAALCKLCAT